MWPIVENPHKSDFLDFFMRSRIEIGAQFENKVYAAAGSLWKSAPCPIFELYWKKERRVPHFEFEVTNRDYQSKLKEPETQNLKRETGAIQVWDRPVGDGCRFW